MVALRVAPDARPRAEIDGDRLRRTGKRGQVGTAATHKCIRATATRQGIVAKGAIEQVVVAIAGQVVGLARSGQVGDPGQKIALGVATQAGSGPQVDRDADERAVVQRRVAAPATDQRIRAAAARERVGPGAAVQKIAVLVADEHVVLAGAQQAADVRQDVALGVAAAGGPGRKVDGDPFCRP